MSGFDPAEGRDVPPFTPRLMPAVPPSGCGGSVMGATATVIGGAEGCAVVVVVVGFGGRVGIDAAVTAAEWSDGVVAAIL